VPIDQREVVFEPFRRLGDALTSTTRGTGLGLHIARQLIEAMTGRIWVDGTPGEGAVFHITAPVAREAAQDPAIAEDPLALEPHAVPSPSPAPSARNQLPVS
jgi:signal transduction histidine kinase